MSKGRAKFKCILALIIVLIVGVNFLFCKKSRGEGYHPEDGWTPPEWVDHLGDPTPQPSEAPEESESPSGAPMLLAGNNAQVYFNQANVVYQYQSSSGKIVAYYHANNNGNDTTAYFPPIDFEPTTRLAGRIFTQGRTLPNSGHTSYTRSIQLDTEGYILAFKQLPYVDRLEPNDRVEWCFRSDSSLVIYEGNFPQSTLDLWQSLGYYNIASQISVQLTCITTIMDADDNNNSALRYTDTTETTWDKFSAGFKYTAVIPEYDTMTFHVASQVIYISINPYGRGNELCDPLRNYWNANNLQYNGNQVPHYIFTEGGIWFSRNVQGSDKLTEYGFKYLMQSLFFPPEEYNAFDRLRDYSLQTWGDDRVVAFVLDLRDSITDLLRGNYNPDIAITLPECTIPIGGTDYTLWHEFDFSLAFMFTSEGNPDEFLTLVRTVRFATDCIITTAFVNSLIAVVIALFDLKLWKGVNGEDISE